MSLLNCGLIFPVKQARRIREHCVALSSSLLDLTHALGKTETGRYLSVFFIRKLDNRALIVTARDMNNNERRRYANR